ncbi:hypothetical protein BHR43_13670 [Aeromonas salmonicida subsp. salmonicida]|nr:hypothetical protein NX85_14480 [Aeromonas salmonicida subsp. salmonicida]KTA86082.1 hypothetical protein VO70_03195 [Aeromonas salmonicida]OKA80775.1 hypothetical protein BHR40_09735 [Aeromonas salmonicida subsp. salmonicida]OKA87475.1 hypothetical protein BHR43_13670 [Aeromonas salmonicida subsp. salmonicida]
MEEKRGIDEFQAKKMAHECAIFSHGLLLVGSSHVVDALVSTHSFLLGFCNISSNLGLISTNCANILSQLVNFVRQILNGGFQFAGVCTTAQQSGQTNNTYQQQFFHF